MIKFIKIRMRGKLLGETIVIGMISFANIVSWDNNNHNLNKLLNSRLGSFIVFVILIFLVVQCMIL